MGVPAGAHFSGLSGFRPTEGLRRELMPTDSRAQMKIMRAFHFLGREFSRANDKRSSVVAKKKQSSWQLLTLRESNNCSTKNSLLLTSSSIFQSSNGFEIRKSFADFHLRTIEESCSQIAALEKIIANLLIEGQSIIGTQQISESNKDNRNCILFARHLTSLDSTIYIYNGGRGSSFPDSRRRRGIFGEFLYPLSSARHALYIRVVSQTDSTKRGNKQQ